MATTGKWFGSYLGEWLGGTESPGFASIVEALSLTDTSSVVLAGGTFSAAISEAISLSSAQDAVVGFYVDTSEALNLGDSRNSSAPSGIYAADIAESMALADSESVQAALTAALTEALSLGHTESGAWSAYVALTESLPLSDLSSQILNASFTDSVWWAFQIQPQPLSYSVVGQNLTYAIGIEAFA